MMLNTPNTLYQKATQGSSLTQIVSQQQPFSSKIIYEELSGDSFSTTHHKLSSPNLGPSQSIDLITDEMEQEENPHDYSLESSNKTQNNGIVVKQQQQQLAKTANFIPVPAQQHMKLMTQPSVQYTYYLGGEMFIDLRWVMNNIDEETLNGNHVHTYKTCPQTYTLKNNKTLMIELESRQQTIFQFKFLPQMLYSLGTPQAMHLGKLLEEYQQYVDVKRQQMNLLKEELQKIDIKARREISIKQAQQILSKQNPNEFTCAYIGFGDEVDFFHQKAQCFSPSMLEILGVSAEEMSKITLRKGSASFFDWKTQFNMTIGRLMLVSRENSQRGYSTCEGEIVTFDGFRLKTTLQLHCHPLNQNLFPYQTQKSTDIKYLLIDYLVIFKFSFHPLMLKQLMHYRNSDASKNYKSNILEEEFQESVYSSIFLEKYYEKELESLGQKRKKIRKTKAKAVEEMSYFSKLQKNKFALSHS